MEITECCLPVVHHLTKLSARLSLVGVAIAVAAVVAAVAVATVVVAVAVAAVVAAVAVTVAADKNGDISCRDTGTTVRAHIVDRNVVSFDNYTHTHKQSTYENVITNVHYI